MARSRRRARPWGAGTLYRRADGRWAAQLFVTESGTGRRVRRTIYGSTSSEVEEKRDALLGAEARREPIPPSKLTVGIYLREWLEHVARPRVRANTLASYQNYVERYLVLDLGQKSLGRLSAREVRMYLDGLRRGGVGDRTVQYVHATLRAALEDAVREELIGKNVAKLVRVPRPAVAEREPLSVDEIRSLLRAHRAQDLLPMLVVFALLGMRRSEVLGLKWDDVDLHLGTLRIHRGLQRIDGVLVELPTKTKRSRRTVPLPPMSFRSCASTRTANRSGKQTPAAPSGVRVVRLHDFRHGSISVLLELGVPPGTAMEIVGHTTIEMTMNVYGHVSLEAKRSAMDQLGDLFGGDGGQSDVEK